MRSSRSRTSGCCLSKSAMFVSGAVGTSTTPGSISSASRSTAFDLTGSTEGTGSSGPSRPVSPCTCTAVRRSRRSGAPAPAATGMSLRPAISSVTSALRVVLSSVWFPATVVTPISSTSGEASASRIAIASSWPGSQSMTIGVVTGPRPPPLWSEARSGRRSGTRPARRRRRHAAATPRETCLRGARPRGTR